MPTTSTRDRIFDFVRKRLLEGMPPSVREVQQAFGFSAVQSAQEQLEALVRDGRLKKEAGVARGYRLADVLGFSAPPLLIPLLGRVQAGALTSAAEDREGVVAIEKRPHFSTPENLFALRVRGESMIHAGILAGDIVIVHKQAQAENGSIVVALVGDEATVKTLRRRRGRIELWPENPDFEPIIPKPDDHFELLGKVIEVRRYLDDYLERIAK